MNIHSIDIPGGYSGTVEVSEGDLKLIFPTATMGNKMKRYNVHLLTPERKNIEFNLLRFSNGEWCENWNLQLDLPGPRISLELREATKKEIIRMRL